MCYYVYGEWGGVRWGREAMSRNAVLFGYQWLLQVIIQGTAGNVRYKVIALRCREDKDSDKERQLAP